MKPLAERIDSFVPRKQVIYRCFACNTSLAILGNKIKYCFNCGEKVDWNGVEVFLPDSLESIWMNSGSAISLDEFERQYIDELNIKQLGTAYTGLYKEDGTPKSCEDCQYALEDGRCGFRPRVKRERRKGCLYREGMDIRQMLYAIISNKNIGGYFL